MQGLPFHSTIVQREFTYIAFALLFSRRSDRDKLIVNTQKIFYVVNSFLKSKFLYVLKTRFDCFNYQINNLDYMEREQIFYRHKAIF